MRHLDWRRLVVLSPHLDDAVLSIGAFLAARAEAGVEVTVLTVLAGDPDCTLPAGRWDGRAGFPTAGAACRARRAEDQRATRLVGASCLWLPYQDDQYPRGGSDEEIRRAILAALPAADCVLVPGYPLKHPDHAWLAGLARTGGGLGPPLARYVEQPYAAYLGARRAPPASPQIDWTVCRVGRRHRRRKRQAQAAYASQRRLLGRGWRLAVRRFERRQGGELIGVPLG